MLEMKIGNENYKVEYSIEASLCDECVEKVTGFLCSVSNAEGKSAIRNFIDTLSDLPGTVLSLFYAGLLEHHGEDGDGAITSKNDAKKLLKLYMKENKDKEDGNYYSLLTVFIEQMEKDGFFKLIGLASMTKEVAEPQKMPKTPMDHQKSQKK